MNVNRDTLAGIGAYVIEIRRRIQSSPIGHRLLQGTFWSLTGSFSSQLLLMLAAIFIARKLGSAEFGQLGIIQSTIGMFGVFAGFGLGMTATKYLAEFRHKNREKAGRILVLSELLALVIGGLASLVMFLIAPWLARNTLASPELGDLLQLGCLILIFSALNGTQLGALAGFESFRIIARNNFIAGIVNFFVIIIAVYSAGLRGAVVGLVISMCLSFIFNHISVRSEARRAGIPIHVRSCWNEIGVIYSFSLPAALSGIMVAPANWICVAMLVNQTDGYHQMGIYNAANQWYAALIFLPNLLGQVLLPILSRGMGDKDIASAKKVLSMSVLINLIATVPALMVLSIMSTSIMALYGEDFSAGGLTLIIVLITATLTSIQNPVGQLIAASNVMWTGFIMNLGWAIVFIIMTMMMVHWGSTGIAAARAIAYLVHSCWTFVFAWRFIMSHG